MLIKLCIFKGKRVRFLRGKRYHFFFASIFNGGAVVEWLEQLGYGAESRRIA